jgi:hypothetical protein
MAKYQTKLSEEITEEMLGFMVREGDGEAPYQLLNENRVKRILVYIMRENEVLSDRERTCS